MGEVLAGAIVLIVVVVLIAGSIGAVVQYARANAPETKQPEYRNHLAMARWIEHGLDDDMERACISSERQASARKMLAEFYNERETK